MIAALLAIALAASAATVPFGGTAHRKTREGNRHYVDGLYAEALRAYTEAQVEVPDAPELFYDIGNVLYRQQDFEGAAEAYTRALLSAPADLARDAAYNLGNARFRQQDYGAARDAYTRALKSDPRDLDAKRNLELALRALRQEQRQQDDRQEQSQDGDSGQQQPEQAGTQPPQEQGEEQPQPQAEQPQDGDSGGKDEAPQPRPEDTADGEMTEEQAKRLLDSAAEDEKQSLRRRMRAKGRDSRQREKDW